MQREGMWPCVSALSLLPIRHQSAKLYIHQKASVICEQTAARACAQYSLHARPGPVVLHACTAAIFSQRMLMPAGGSQSSMETRCSTKGASSTRRPAGTQIPRSSRDGGMARLGFLLWTPTCGKLLRQVCILRRQEALHAHSEGTNAAGSAWRLQQLQL